jgi:DNA modification methylase/ParB-like chromosome segregation protein Spo0J
MQNQSKGLTVPQQETVFVVETSSIYPNLEKGNLYSVDKAYEGLRLSIEHFGIKEPLIVEKESNVVIAGNRRLKVAIELGIQQIPVIFRELGEKDRKIVYITHENQREKTYSQYLAEYKILQERYPLSQGARTDLRATEAFNKEALRVLTGLSRTTLFYLLEIERLAEKKYKGGRASKSFKHIWNDLDHGYKTPKYWYDKLKPKEAKSTDVQNINDHSIYFEACKILNKSCEDLIDVEDGSIACFVSSPPYWGFKRKYGKGEGYMLGLEKTSEEYLKNLVRIYKNALPKLKKGGSIWVNLTDVCKDGEYAVIPHRFVLKMKEIGLILNDELIWTKHNPIPTSGNRMTRAYENIFQFVRKSDKKGFFYDKSWITDGDALKFKVERVDGKNEEKNLTSTFDFRDGILKTNSPNIEKLRKSCKKRGINCDHDATFTIDVAMVPILLTSKEGDTVLDLFGGTGTVAVVAGALGRKSITYEQNPQYCKVAEMRLTDLISMWESTDFEENNTKTIFEKVEKVAA